MKQISGYVERILFRNQENGYTVLVIKSGHEEITCVGSFNYIVEGEYVEITGEETYHSMYGDQIRVDSYEIKVANDALSIIKYLGSGAIKGIGEALAKRVVDKFGEDTFAVIESEPERLAEVKGISLKKAQDIYEQVADQKNMRDAMIFLQKYGISTNLSVKIYEKYKDELYDILKTNPYRLAEDIEGVGFKIADEIAIKGGILVDSKFRIKSGILYTLYELSMEGNSCSKIDEVKERACEILGINVLLDDYIEELAFEQKIKVCSYDNEVYLYDMLFYNVETSLAHRLISLDRDVKKEPFNDKYLLKMIEDNLEITFDDQQINAISKAMEGGVFVITGGPGTGKTTIINGIINILMAKGISVKLCAPTGKAAKRMTESTGYEASTIHRLLEITSGDGNGRSFAGRDESDPLEAGAVIVDEMSMVDIFLMNTLLKALAPGTRLILVGDKDQLPSVGPGSVLKDIIDSETISVVKLEKIFRQNDESKIVINAHKINAGTMIDLSKNSQDFLYLKRNDVNSILGATKTLIVDKLPAHLKCNMNEIQVLTPMRKGALGVENINKVLQYYLNPEEPGKAEKEFNNKLFREGDKVMQIKNNYDYEWEIHTKNGIVLERGMGIFNGDTGVIKKISEYAQMMVVAFDDGKIVNYQFDDLNDLELAYAVTIHKSQGSEYPAIIIPLLNGPFQLMNRNILYTAITRAKECVCIIGSDETFANMIKNKSIKSRTSGLNYILKSIAE